MTNSHDFKAAREGFDILCKMQSDLELPRLYKDAEKTIRFALQLAEKVCGEPSRKAVMAGINSGSPTFNGEGYDYAVDEYSCFQAMRDQMIKEIEQGDE